MCGYRHPPEHAADGNLNTMWADSAVLAPTGVSTLEVRFAPTEIASYELVASADMPARDPARWVLWGFSTHSRGWELLDARLPYAGVPPARLSSFGKVAIGSIIGEEDLASTPLLVGAAVCGDAPTPSPRHPQHSCFLRKPCLRQPCKPPDRRSGHLQGQG